MSPAEPSTTVPRIEGIELLVPWRVDTAARVVELTLLAA